MGGTTQGQGFTLLSLCDRLQDLLANTDFEDVPVVLGDGTPVRGAWIEKNDDGGRFIWLQ